MDDDARRGIVSDAEKDSDGHLTEAARQAMLEEIAQIGLVWGRDTASSFGAYPDTAANAFMVSRQERIALLLRCWPEIVAGLNRLVRQPDTQLARKSVSLPIARAQGGPESAARIARKPGALRAWLRSHADTPVDPAPSMLEEFRSISSFDTPSNRFVVALLERFTSEAALLASLAAFCGEEDDAAKLEEAVRQAQRWRRISPLNGLMPLRESACANLCGGEATLRHNPTYAALVRCWQTLHAHLYFDWTSLPWLRLPSVEAWRLYEIWCFLKVSETLAGLGWRRLDSPGIRVRNRALRLELVTARDSRLRFRRDGDVLDLFYQPFFPSANQRRQTASPLFTEAVLESDQLASTAQEAAWFVSTSHVMQPDIALLQRGTSGTRLFLLDAKFRRYIEPGDEQNDVNKMHTYRDAIVTANAKRRRNASSAPLSSAVAAAWSVFAGEARSQGASPLHPLSLEVALRAYPRPTPEQPFGTAPVGAVRLRPGEPDGSDYLRRLLTHWLDAC